YVSVALGQNIQKIAFDPIRETFIGDPSWVTSGSKLWQMFGSSSPDGQWLALASDRPQEDIYLVRADGSGLRQLTSDVALDRGPRWSPDAKRILFQSTRGGSWDAWSRDPDGSGLTQLTKNAAAHHPRWSPDGTRLSYFDLVH